MHRPGIVAVAVLSLMLSACTQVGQPATQTPTLSAPTETAARTTATRQPVTPTRIATPSRPPGVASTATQPQPSPTASPLAPTVSELRTPLVVDSERGRLYLAGVIDGQEQIVALDATDGQLVATYGISGPFAVDGLHGWLYVDRGGEGLAVIGLETAGVHATVELPVSDLASAPAPVADPLRAEVLAFRNNELLFIDPQQGEITSKLIFGMQADASSCGVSDSPLPIQGAVLDTERRVLHVEFQTYVCTPWTGYTIVTHEMDSRKELARRRGSGPSGNALAHNGYLYGSSWYRMGFGQRWAELDLQPLANTSHWQGGLADWVLDSSHLRLYEAAGRHLRVHDATTMALQMVVPSPVAGQLAGYDSGTDQLYFLAEGQLQRYPAAEIRAPSPQPLVTVQPPTTPVRSLIVSPGWPLDQTLFGIWEVPVPDAECWVFGQQHGLLLISLDGGETWNRPPGLDHACGYVSSLAVSAAYAQDHTVLAGLPGLGVWQSADAGQSWQPLSADLPSMGITQILLSPAWGQDQTAFVRTASSSELFRTADGGSHWEPLGVQNMHLVDMSGEYAQDRTLMGMFWESGGGTQLAPNELLLSTDAGVHWHHSGELGASHTASLLSLAPLFAQWQVVFVHGENGWLYRSENGGAHWVPVLHTAPPERDPFNTSSRLVYAPEMETRRSLFLLVTVREGTPTGQVVRGTLFQSDDGGQKWREAAVPGGIAPTAVAISPYFAVDRLLFLGLSDGHVVTWRAG